MEELQTMELTAEESLQGKFLTFAVADGNYGIEIHYVTEIIGVQEITHVPHTDHYIKGIINLRGTIVPVMDMRLKFGLPPMEYTERTCIVVLNMDDMFLGLIVDQVQDVLDIAEDELQAPPKINATANHFIQSVASKGDSVKQLLDIRQIFGMDDEDAYPG